MGVELWLDWMWMVYSSSWIRCAMYSKPANFLHLYPGQGQKHRLFRAVPKLLD